MPNYKEISLYNGEVLIKFDPDKHAYYRNGELKKNGDPKMKRITGVTTFCGIINKPFLIPWAINITVDFIRNNMEALQVTDGNQLLEMARKEADSVRDLAAEIGLTIHKWIEEHIKGNYPDMPEDPRVIEGVNSFLNWVKSENIEFIWSEKIVYSKKYDYVGTADIGIVKDGKKYLLDIKTGNALYDEVRLQTSAYLMAEMEESGVEYAGRYALRISKETKEEYMERMNKKNERRKIPMQIPPFQIFEAVYLDDDEKSLERDFEGFLSCLNLHRWKSEVSKLS